MHVTPAERAARWQAQARLDRRAAERLADDLWLVACFHGQQASEKSLKALITRVSGDTSPTPAAQVLLRALADLGESVPPDVARAANALDRFYIPTRYPDALDFADASLVFTTEDARSALAWADVVIAWTDARITEIDRDETAERDL